MKMSVTLIGKKLAKKGEVFQYLGSLVECKDCNLKNVCFGLDCGKYYRITGIREKEHACSLHEENKVVIVEIEEVPFSIIVPKKQAIDGGVISFQPLVCDDIACSHYYLCNPLGLKSGMKLTITSIENSIICSKNQELSKVQIRW